MRDFIIGKSLGTLFCEYPSGCEKNTHTIQLMDSEYEKITKQKTKRSQQNFIFHNKLGQALCDYHRGLSGK